ncbi:MAG: phosphate acyltransferase PlsX [Syntrophobacterales bacterium]|jgi:glycerol-3-phosphate acyltransferase PlsX|nr:phosphate acyltransferase PlsX [Syntrophobacterales bacterium]
MVRIAVDGMGGDFAPHAVIRGAEAVHSARIADVVLVGDEARLSPLVHDSTIQIAHTPVEVGMDESPSNALRKKRDCSMNVALELMKEGTVQGVVTAGNSGAAMGFSIFTLGRLSGVDRPAIATLHPNAKGGTTVLIDSGGNVDCKAGHIVQFAIMGDIFARCAFGFAAPKVGLLSNATEETKGNELTREANSILKTMDLNYLGYVEGTDIHNGNTDVVVTDGFVGNVALKITEGIAEMLMLSLKEQARDRANDKTGQAVLEETMKRVNRRFDYTNIGGAPLLGVDGISIICHGRSSHHAIRSAIIMAKNFVDKNLNQSIKETMRNYESLQKIKER